MHNEKSVEHKEKSWVVSKRRFVDNSFASPYIDRFYYLLVDIQHIAGQVKNIDMTTSVSALLRSKTFLFFISKLLAAFNWKW